MKKRWPFMLAILLVAGLGHANAQNNKPTLILNEDDSHFLARVRRSR